MKHGAWIGIAAIGLSLAACESKSGTGGVRGRVVNAAGTPARGVRVMLDGREGRSAITDVRGEFRLGAKAGSHVVVASHAVANAGASVEVEVEIGENADVGDVVLQDCDEIIIMAGGDPNAPDGGEGGEEGGTEPGDPTYPCTVEPPPPPPELVTIESFESDWASGWLDSWGLYGYGDDADAMAAIDFFVGGDFTAGGTTTIHIDEQTATAGLINAYAGLFTYDSYGYYYFITSGDLTVTVGDDGDGDPSTVAFQFSGSNLEFAYYDWAGTTDTAYVAKVNAASAAGTAYVYTPPEPPTEDVTIPTFVADWKDLYLCVACTMDGGDALFVYAWDSTNGADLSLFAPVAALPAGSSLLTASPDFSNEIYGGASFYGVDGNGGWFYVLDHLTANVGGPIAAGAELSLVLTDAQFDYQFADGGVVVQEGAPTDGGNGGSAPGDPTEPTEPPASEFQLFIGSADVSGIVNAFDHGCDDGNGGGTEPGPGGEVPPSEPQPH